MFLIISMSRPVNSAISVNGRPACFILRAILSVLSVMPSVLPFKVLLKSPEPLPKVEKRMGKDKLEVGHKKELYILLAEASASVLALIPTSSLSSSRSKFPTMSFVLSGTWFENGSFYITVLTNSVPASPSTTHSMVTERTLQTLYKSLTLGSVALMPTHLSMVLLLTPDLSAIFLTIRPDLVMAVLRLSLSILYYRQKKGNNAKKSVFCFWSR
jgi:hypothetical protein